MKKDRTTTEATTKDNAAFWYPMLYFVCLAWESNHFKNLNEYEQ